MLKRSAHHYLQLGVLAGEPEQVPGLELLHPPIARAQLHDELPVWKRDRISDLLDCDAADVEVAFDVRLDAQDGDVVFDVRDLSEVAILLEVGRAEGGVVAVAPVGPEHDVGGVQGIVLAHGKLKLLGQAVASISSVAFGS